MNSVITITTDFGDQFAAIQLRAVIAGLEFDGHVIENHSVTPFSISEGAFEIQQIAKFSPSGSVHVGVVDPGVGSTRWGIIIQTKRSWFVGPNNGIFYPVASDEEVENVWKLQEHTFGESIANTFHGRDVFIKAAVFLAQGKHPTKFSCIKVKDNILKKRSFIEGEIVHIDAYGNYKIYWPHELVVGRQIIVQSKKNKRFTIPVVKTFEDVDANKPLALFGSHCTLEIAVNLSNAQNFFRYNLGEKINIQQL